MSVKLYWFVVILILIVVVVVFVFDILVFGFEFLEIFVIEKNFFMGELI